LIYLSPVAYHQISTFEFELHNKLHDKMSPATVIDHTLPESVPTKTRATISTPLPNPSLMVTADHKLKQEEAPVYAPARGEVLLHIKATGVCGYGRVMPA
jgi:hypothetical protein